MSDANGRDLVALIAPLARRLRRDCYWVREPGGYPGLRKQQFNRAKLEKHVADGPFYGLAQILPGQSTTLVGLLDLDSHAGEVPWDNLIHHVADLCIVFEKRGLRPIAFRSSGGTGAHIYVVWDEPQDAYSVRCMLGEVLTAVGLKSGVKGLSKGQVEVFPKQNEVAPDGYGNMTILPLANKSCWLDPALGYEPTPKDTPFDWPASPSVAFVPKPEREDIGPVETSVDLEEFRKALDAIPNSAEDELDYDEWRNVIFSIHHATDGGDEGLALAHEFSARSSKYDPQFLDERVWPYIHADRDGGITDRYVVSKAGEYGWTGVCPEDFDIVEPEPEFEDISEEETEAEKLRFSFQPVKAFLDAPPPDYAIKGVLPRADLGIIYGEPGAGKSFVALDMAAAIARGEPWRDKRVRKGRVAFIAAEGAAGFRQRIKAYEQHHECEIPLLIMPAAPNLAVKEDVREVIKAVKACGGLDYVFIDTLAQVTAGSNENSGEEMGRVISHAQAIRRVTGAMVVFIHHSGKDSSRGARGWSGLRGAADVELEVVRVDSARAVTITKMKDGMDGVSFGFALKPVSIGIDEDGDLIESCVVTHNDDGRPEKPRGGPKKAGSADPLSVAIATLQDESPAGEEVILSALSDVGVPAKDRAKALRDLERCESVRFQNGVFYWVEDSGDPDEGEDLC